VFLNIISYWPNDLRCFHMVSCVVSY